MSENEDFESLPQLNDPKVKEAVEKVLKDISNQWTIVEGYRSAVSEQFKGLKEEHDVPLRLLRKLARAYHRQTFQTEVQENEDFQAVYEKIFGAED